MDKDLIFRVWEFLEYLSNTGAELGLDVDYFLTHDPQNQEFLLKNLGEATSDGLFFRVKVGDYLKALRALLREEVKYDFIEESIFGSRGERRF